MGACSVTVCVAGTVLIVAALHDLAFRTVPNWMPLVVAVAAALARAGQGDLAASAGVAAIVLAATAGCWQRGWLGGGDVKLMAASSMLVPPALAMTLLLNVALAGGALALVYLGLGLMVRRPRALGSKLARPGLLRRIWRAECYRIHRRGPLPYASAIAAGSLLMLVRG
jgi:prepilin peptidase CpaA